MFNLFIKRFFAKKFDGKIIVYAIAYIFSLFTAIFASQIVIENLPNLGNSFVKVISILFIEFFIVVNEGIKIYQCRKKKPNNVALVFSFCLSLTLSGFGFYFMSNNTLVNNIKLSANKDNNTAKIELSYTNKLDSLTNLSYYNTTDYKVLNAQIKDLKRSNNENKLAEIEVIKGQINQNKQAFENIKNANIEQLKTLKNAQFSQINTSYANGQKQNDRNNLLSIIYIIAIVISEGFVYFLNRYIANNKEEQIQNNEYFVYRQLLKYIYSIKTKDDVFSIKTLQFSHLANHYCREQLIKNENCENKEKRELILYNFVKPVFDTIIQFKLCELAEDNSTYYESKYKLLYEETEALKKFDSIYKLATEY